MTLQAQALGLACRQFRAFDLSRLTAELRLGAGWEVVSMTAVVRPAYAELPRRDRRALHTLRSDALAP